ncbi:hypothetical protein KI387_022718, partial [Taxus chinensis]
MGTGKSSGVNFHFVLVHGACLGGWCWYKVADILTSAGHTVSSLDMAGGGIHPAIADTVLSLQDYNRPLTDFFSALPSQDKVILVGHSAGGFNLSLAMEQFPCKISAAVFVSAFMPLSGTTFSDDLNQVLSRIGNFGDSIFYNANGEDNPPTSVTLGKKFCKEFLLQNTPSSDIMLTESLGRRFPLWQEAISYSDESYGSVRRAYVVAKEDKLIVEELQRKIVADNPPQMVYEIEGSDHCTFFSKPGRLAE